MIEIKTIDDCYKVQNTVHRRIIIRVMELLVNEDEDIFKYNPDEDGFVIYIDKKEDILQIEDFISPNSWESVIFSVQEKLYEIIILYNNEYTMSYFVPAEMVEGNDLFRADLKICAEQANSFLERLNGDN